MCFFLAIPLLSHVKDYFVKIRKDLKDIKDQKDIKDKKDGAYCPLCPFGLFLSRNRMVFDLGFPVVYHIDEVLYGVVKFLVGWFVGVVVLYEDLVAGFVEPKGSKVGCLAKEVASQH